MLVSNQGFYRSDMHLILIPLLLSAWGGRPSDEGHDPTLDCIEITLEDAFGAADLVFVGTVIGLNEMAHEENWTRAPAMVEVEWSHKGEELPPVVVVYTPGTDGANGYYFHVGTRYLIFARWNPNVRGQRLIHTTACDGNQEYASVTDAERAALRALEE